MSGGYIRSCIQSLLKLVNSFLGMFGMAMIIYSIWMIRSWFKHFDDDSSDYPPPWFMYTMLGPDMTFAVHMARKGNPISVRVGATLCVITFSGHIAAETANGCCLYCYLVFVILLLMLEGAVTMDVFLNRNWEEDFPEDPTGNFNEFKGFIQENFDICKWVGLAVQGLSVFLALILKALGPHQERHYDSDDEYTIEEVPLLRNYVNQSPYVVSGTYGTR